MQAWKYLAAVSLALLALAPAAARADPDEAREAVAINLDAPAQANLGDRIELRAKVTTAGGEPVEGAHVTFLSPVAWNDELAEEMEIGAAATDEAGVATLQYEMRRSGDVDIIAKFEGDESHEAAEAETSLDVAGEGQLYLPSVGIRAWISAPWLIALILATVWSLYFFAGTRVLAIAFSTAAAGAAAVVSGIDVGRRQFLARAVVPVGMLAAIAAAGSGLLAIVARSPYTHWNTKRFDARTRYGRTPLARIGAEPEMMEMPEVLEREVSFSQEVLPILLLKGGPHAVAPEHSPAPAGVRFDSYEHIMEREHLVVPGEPMESELVTVLLDRAMGMPPAGNALSEEEIQLIFSWVAQGAKDT